jgi:putative heme-binding domain-containing protein
MTEAFAGWHKASKPAAWDQASAAFAKSTDVKVRDLARELGAVFGDGRALDSLRALALDDKRDAAARRSALRSLTDARVEGLRALCEKLFEVRDLATAAAAGLALSDDPAVGNFMIARFARLQPHERPAVLSALVSRPAWAKQLLEAVAKDRIPRTELTAFHLRAIRSSKDDVLVARLREVWGEFRDSDADKSALIEKWKERLTPAVLARADRSKGHEVYKTACASCHKLYGEGAAIGPDLTGSGRDNLDYLLQNIADPSAVVPAEFLLSSLTMKDDRTLSGIIRSRTSKTITLQTLTEVANLEASDVKAVETARLSLMPEGLLDALTETQVRDLIGFLMSKEPPATRTSSAKE